MKTWINRQLDPNSGDAGGLPPTLASLTEDKPTTDLAEAAAKQAADAAAAAAAAGASAGAPPPEKEAAPPTGDEGGDDGKGNEGGEGGVEGDDAGATTDDFWGNVDALRGESIVVEYPEDMDPLSPEGVYHREKVIESRAVDQFEDYLKKADPRGYAYLLHRQGGGSDDDFFSKKTISLPEYELFKADQDVQAKLYKASLLSNGLDEDTAQAVVEKVIKDNKLFEKSDAAYKKAEQDFKKDLQAIEDQNSREAESYSKNVNALSQQLQSTVNDNKMNIIVPDNDKPGFLQFVKESVEYDKQSGKFLIVQPVEGEKLNRLMESMYLLYKQGDLKALIKREAKTLNRQRLGDYVSKSKQDKTPHADTSSTKLGKTLGEI